MIKAAIFDMDGLLIDSEPYWRQSHRKVIGSYGHEVTEDDVRTMAGRRTVEVTAHWRERFKISEPGNEELAEEIINEVISAIHQNGQALVGARELIQELHKLKLPMAVASSSSDKLIKVVLKRLDLQKYMKVVHSAEHEERGKPFPDVFLSAAISLGVAAEDCVVFEDSINGVLAAEAAGMYCVAVPEEPYNLSDFASADLVVASLEAVNWKVLQSLNIR